LSQTKVPEFYFQIKFRCLSLNLDKFPEIFVIRILNSDEINFSMIIIIKSYRNPIQSQRSRFFENQELIMLHEASTKSKAVSVASCATSSDFCRLSFTYKIIKWLLSG